MKKMILSAAFTLLVTGIIAQDSGGMTSKKGEPILPEANDWALSIDARPVMGYLGNMMNGNVNNASPSFGYPGTPLAITGKMYKTDKKAYRAVVRLGFGSTKQDSILPSIANPTTTVTDSKKVSHSNVVVGVGYEIRRGKTRLQGFYGGMVMLGIGGSDTTYSYGNAITATNSASRLKENKPGGTFMFGVRGFVGAEYFIFPKMSIGAEFGWGLSLNTTGMGERTTEEWDAVNTAPKPTVTKTGKSSTFGIDTDVNGTQLVPATSLNLILHF